MTDSKDDVPWHKKIKKEKDREEISELPQWAKVALVDIWVNGVTYKEAAKRQGKSSTGALPGYAKSPAAKKWKAKLDPFLDDPVALAKAMLAGSAAHVTSGYMIALEQAAAAGDYAEVARMSRDLLDRVDVVGEHKTKQQAQIGNITLQLPSNFGQALEVSSEPLQIEAEVVDDE